MDGGQIVAGLAWLGESGGDDWLGCRLFKPAQQLSPIIQLALQLELYNVAAILLVMRFTVWRSSSNAANASYASCSAIVSY